MTNRFDKNGFTLIELLVVVAMIGILSAVFIPAFLGYLSKKEKQKQEVVNVDKPKKVTNAPNDTVKQDIIVKKEPPAVLPKILSADIKIALKASQHLYGLNVYSKYNADFKGRFKFKNNSNTLDTIKLEFPFPSATTQARNVSMKFTSSKQGEPFEPDGVEYGLSGIRWIGTLKRGEYIIVDVTYGAEGRDLFSYKLPGFGISREVNINLTLEGIESEFIPDSALQPTKKESGRLEWTFENLVTDRPVVVELPGAMSPVGRVIMICKLAGLGVLLFGAGFWYMSEKRYPGHLDTFRWAHFFLLALTYSAFFFIFTVLGFRGEMGFWSLFIISALFSIPLLILHVSRIVDFGFAINYVLPLTFFTIIIVVSGVYGGNYSKYAYIASTILTLSYVTITYKDWARGRQLHREKIAKERGFENLKKKAQGLFESLQKDHKQNEKTIRKASEVLKGECYKSNLHLKGKLQDELMLVNEHINGFKGLERELVNSNSTNIENFISTLMKKKDDFSNAVRELGSNLNELTQRERDEKNSRQKHEGIVKKKLGDLLLLRDEATLMIVKTDAFKFSDDGGVFDDDIVEIQRHVEQIQALSGEFSTLAEIEELEDHQRAAVNLEKRVEGLFETLTEVLANLGGSIRDMKNRKKQQKLVASKSVEKEIEYHCLSCGVRCEASKFCPACGVELPVELKCSKCGGIFYLPVNLLSHIDNNLASKKICCIYCGEKHTYSLPKTVEKTDANKPAIDPDMFKDVTFSFLLKPTPGESKVKD